MNTYKLAVLPGDGIGPEITDQAVAVLEAAARLHGVAIDAARYPIGGAAIDACGHPLPKETVAACLAADAVLLGAVGGPRWDSLPPQARPEQGILGIRSRLGLFANLRPATVYPALRRASPLKDEILAKGLDIMVVRELTGGIYFGDRGRCGSGAEEYAYDTEEYTAMEIERIAHVAFGLAMGRGGRLCSVDKANVLDSSRLWRDTVNRVAAQYPGVELSHMYVDNAAMQLVRNPGQFDVIVTNNIFGDILSDQASQITGSIGMLPSASLGEGSLGLYEPIHGSAPDIAGRGIANPLAAILSAAMLLRCSLGMAEAAQEIEAAVAAVLESGARTADICGPGQIPVSTAQMGQLVLQGLGSR